MIWLSVLFIATRVVIFLYLAGRGSDLWTQKDYVLRLFSGQVPFRDFSPEYPPLVFLYTGIPIIAGFSQDSYFAIFRVLSCAVDCGIWAMVLWTNKGRIDQCLLYILGTTALGPLIYDRIDIVLGGLLLIAVVSLLKGQDGPFKLAVGTGIAFKLIPIVFVPMILAREWRKAAGADARDTTIPSLLPSPIKGEIGLVSRPCSLSKRNMLWTCTLLALPTILSFGTIALFGGYRLDKLFEFHAKRPIQLESGPASVEMMLMMFGVPGQVKFEFKCSNLHTPYENWLVTASTVLLGAVCIDCVLMVLRRNMNTQSFALLLGAVLSAALAFSKVLSPQYLLFLLPVLAVLQVPPRRTAAIANWLLIAMAYILTGLIFPWWYGDLISLKPAAEFMLIMRNELLVVLAISLAYRAWCGCSAADQSIIGIPSSPATVPLEPRSEIPA